MGTPVVERTAELAQSNVKLAQEVVIRKKAEPALHTKAIAFKKQAVRVKEANAALRALLRQRDADRIELEEKVLHNVNQLIMPYVGKLKRKN